MKQLIFHMAMLLIKRNGQTTTKEVKDKLHEMFNQPGTLFNLTQTEVSNTMSTLLKESQDFGYEGEAWGRDNRDSNSYFTYFIDCDVDEDDDSQDADSDNSNGSNWWNVQPNATTSVASSTPVAVPSVGSSELDTTNGQLVAYVANKPTCIVQGDDWNTIRKKAFNLFKTLAEVNSYDDIRKISTKRYNSKYCKD